MYFFGNNSGTVSDASHCRRNGSPRFTLVPRFLARVGPSCPVAAGSRSSFRIQPPLPAAFTNDHNTNIQTAYGLNTESQPSLRWAAAHQVSLSIFPQELGGFNWPKVQDRNPLPVHRSHFYTVGKHAIKFVELHRDAFSGGAMRQQRQNQVHRREFRRRQFVWVEDFFAGLRPTALADWRSQRKIHNWGYAGFVQDDFRVTSM